MLGSSQPSISSSELGPSLTSLRLHFLTWKTRKLILVTVLTGFSSVQFSHSVMSDSLRPHGLQHVRLPCPLPSPRACSNSEPLNWWWHPTILSSFILLILLLLHSIFPSIRIFFNELALCIRRPKYCCFSFRPFNEYLGLISFRTDRFDQTSQPAKRPLGEH